MSSEMVVIRYSGQEAELSAPAAELQRLRAKIVSLLSSTEHELFYPSAPSCAEPYEHCLSGIRVQRTTGKTLVAVSEGILTIQGGDDSLARFASWFNVDPGAGSGSHSHFEPMPSDPWHSSESVALAVTVA